MTLQQTLDLLKRNDQGALFRKDRQMVFSIGSERGDWRIGLVGLDDEGTIVVELVPDVEQSAEDFIPEDRPIVDYGDGSSSAS